MLLHPKFVAATRRETFPCCSHLNPAARDAIAQRVNETAADLKLTATAFRAERTEPTLGDRRKIIGLLVMSGPLFSVVTADCRPRRLGDDPINCRPSNA